MQGVDRATRPGGGNGAAAVGGVARLRAGEPGERQILDRLAARADEIASLVADAALAEATVSGVARAVPVQAEIRALTRRHLEGFVAAARSGTGPSDELLAKIKDWAALRARQMPLSAQLHSLLLTQREILTAISREAGDGAGSRGAALALSARAFDYSAAMLSALAQAYVETAQGELAELDTARRSLVDALLAGTTAADAGPELARRAAGLGFDANTRYVVALVAVDDQREAGPYRVPPRWAIPALARAAGRTQRSVFAVARDNELIALLEAGGASGAPEAPEALDQAWHREVLDRAGADIRQARGAALRAGIGGPFTGICGFADAYRQARRALRHTSADRPVLAGPGDLLLFDELTAARGDCAELVPAATRAALSDPPLRAALDAFIAADLNVAAAAKALYLHPNSLRYRLWRITKDTGRDLRKVSDLLELIAACKVLDANVPPEVR